MIEDSKSKEGGWRFILDEIVVSAPKRLLRIGTIAKNKNIGGNTFRKGPTDTHLWSTSPSIGLKYKKKLLNALFNSIFECI